MRRLWITEFSYDFSFLKNLVTGQQWQLTDGPYETGCSISGEYVIYRDANPDRTFEWFLPDLMSSEHTGLLPKSMPPIVMKVSGRQLVYVLADLSGATGAIYVGSVPEEHVRTAVLSLHLDLGELSFGDDTHWQRRIL